MRPTETARVVPAPSEEIFAILSQPARSAEVIPCVVDAEVPPGPAAGVGMRFRETRAMGKRRMIMEFEVTECREPEHLRIVCEDHGTVWDSVFTLTPRESGTEVRIAMDARGQKWPPRVLNPLMRPLFRKGLVDHLDALEAHFSPS